MAKTITLTVNVDDTQFKAFQKNFNDLQQKMQTLTTNWNNISQSINKSSKQSRDYLQVLTSTFSMVRGIVPFFEKITANISKWSAIVGSLTMMLGTGAGLFGIERLTNTLIQRRRQVMGLGGDWGGVQAAQVGTAATMNDPMSIMQKIRLGSLGDQPIRRGLLAAKISPQDILNKKPEEIYEQVIRNIPQILGEAPRGQEVPFLRQRGLTRFMPEEDWMKFIKPGGGVNMEEVQRIIKQIEEAKKRGLTPEEGRKWADLYGAAKGFVLDIQTKLGSALSGVAVSMTGLSKSFGDLLGAFLEMPAVKRALESLKTWLDGFADYLKSDEAKEKLKAWTEELEKVPWAQLASTIGSFISELGTVLRALLAFKGAIMGGAAGARLGAVFGPWGALIGGVGGAAGGGLLGWNAPEALGWGLGLGVGQQGDPNAPANFNQRFGDWRRNYYGFGQGWMPTPGSLMWGMPPPTFPVNPQNPNATTPPAATGGTQQTGSAASTTNFAGGGTRIGGTNFASMRGGSLLSPGGVNMASWNVAARGAVPTDTGSGWSAAMASNTFNYGGKGGKRGQSGALDIDNWQLNRTAQLRIDNVAGANIHTTGVAMG